MLEQISKLIRRGMVNQMLHFQRKKQSALEISLGQCWQGIGHCVVCWPETVLEVKAGEVVINRLREKFPQAAITVISLPGMIASLPEVGARLFKVQVKDFNFFGLPNRRLRDSLKNLKADLAIDLSYEPNPLSAYCCTACGARTRIGFALARYQQFYNYQIAPKPERRGVDKYKVLAEYIG